jgi:hypothetical protein
MVQMWGVVPEVRMVTMWGPEVGTARSPAAPPCWSSPGSGTEPESSSSKQKHIKGTVA